MAEWKRALARDAAARTPSPVVLVTALKSNFIIFLFVFVFVLSTKYNLSNKTKMEVNLSLDMIFLIPFSLVSSAPVLSCCRFLPCMASDGDDSVRHSVPVPCMMTLCVFAF